MRTSDRIWAIGLAVVVWLFAGYAVVTRSAAPVALKSSAFDTNAAVGLAIGRP